MIDDARRIALAYILIRGYATEEVLKGLLVEAGVGTGAERQIVRELLAKGYIRKDRDGRLRVTETFEAFKSDFGVSLTTPSGGRMPMFVYPVFLARKILVRPNSCFVIMPFSKPFINVYTKGIRPAISETRHECRRADDLYTAGPIVERIWRYLIQSAIVIADLTTRNGNVLYELGIAHTLGKEVILLTQQSKDIPFDLRHHRWLSYTTTEDGLATLRSDLIRAIQDVSGPI
jgi:hypothetical protein